MDEDGIAGGGEVKRLFSHHIGVAVNEFAAFAEGSDFAAQFGNGSKA
jgi:hypothetical protein